MPVPDQVRKQSEAAQAHFDAIDNPNPEAEAQQGQESVAPAVEPVQTEQPAQTTHTEVEHTSEDTTYRQRYQSLQGMYNAEVPRLQAANREATARIQNLEALLASLQNAPPQPLVHSETQQLLSDNERSEYGDSIDVMRKVSREELAPLYGRLTQLEQSLSAMAGTLNTSVIPQVTHVAQQQHLSREDMFWQALSARVPNWQQVNNDKQFHEWLLEVDPMAGVSRQRMLEAQHQNLNPEGVAAFFTTWLGLSGKYEAPAQPNRSANELEKQVAPGKSRSTSTPAPKATQTYAPTDIARFFDDVRKGKYKGREDERNRIERDIFAAQRDGRIGAPA